ncbi:hypothetical protein V6N13_102119 [Hibiscus sabdariffa]
MVALLVADVASGALPESQQVHGRRRYAGAPERVKIDSKPARDRRHLQNEHAEKRRPKPKPPISPIKDPLPPNLKPVLVKGTTDDRGETPLQNNR